MFLVGVVFYFLIILSTILLGSYVAAFNDLPSFAFVLLSNVAVLIITKGIKDFSYGIKVLTLKNIKVDSGKLKESIEIFKLLHKSSFGISFFGFLIGIISMLSKLDDPSSIGPSMAIALLIAFYSTMLDLVIISPARFMLSKIERNFN